MVQEKIYLSRLESEFAAAMLAGCEQLDPTGRSNAEAIEQITRDGLCFAATGEDSQAVYVIQVDNGIAWVSACRGFGATDWTNVLLPVIEMQAKGCAAVAFQTARPGLVRKAKQQGYSVTGWILKKAIQ